MKNENLDMLTIIDTIELLQKKGYTIDEILDMVDNGIDEIFDDQFEFDFDADDDDDDED